MEEIKYTQTNIRQMYLAIRNTYDLVISVNFTKDKYSIIESKLTAFPVSQNNAGFQDFSLGLYKRCHPEDIRNYPMLGDFDTLIPHLLNNKGVYTFEVRVKPVDSPYVWYEGSYFIVDNEDNDDLILLMLFTDISDRKLIEENLKDSFIAAEIAMKAKTDFLSRMSQDLRTPINLIVSMNEYARQNIKDEKVVLDCLAKMDISSKYLFQLIDNILEMSEIEGGKFSIDNSPFDLLGAIDDVISIYEDQLSGKQIEFVSNINCSNLHNVTGDVFRFKQILKNLLSNSVKYAPVGGTVSIETFFTKLLYNKAFFTFIIENDGPPLNEKEIDDIFHPFVKGETTSLKSNFNGIGLGLSICKNIVDLLGGSIHASNDWETGRVRFEVNLSFEIDEDDIPEDLELTEDNTRLQLREKRILIVDDKRHNYHTIKSLLESRGISVDLAINGLEALEAFENHNTGYYSVIMMSEDLPLMSGFDATKAIRNSFNSDGSTIPIICIVSNNLQQKALTFAEAGINDYIFNPVDMDKLISCLNKYI